MRILLAKLLTEKTKGAKFSDYFDTHEPIAHVPSHRALAMFRGRNEGISSYHLILIHNSKKPPKRAMANS